MSVIANELTKLFRGTADPASTEIAQILSIKPPGGEVKKVPTTVLGATAQTPRPGKIPDSGEVTLRIQYDPSLAGHITLADRVKTPVVEWWMVRYDGDGLTTPARDRFQGYVLNFSPNESEAEDENNLEADLTIQITGSVNRVAGS